MRSARRACLAAVCLCIITLTAARDGVAADTILIRLAYIGDSGRSAYLGVQLGLAEANVQGQFLGQSYTLDTVDIATLNATSLQPYLAVLAAGSAADVLRVSQAAQQRPVFNLTAHDDTLRNACIGNLLHVIRSEQMQADAEHQWRQKNPQSHARAFGWHPDFKKYAARDLNKRFRKKFGVAMDEYAWAGWAAIRMIADTVVRGQTQDPQHLLTVLREALSFDGQKGEDLDFRETGQLRQLLILQEDGRLLGQAPVRGVAAGLDSLGRVNCGN